MANLDFPNGFRFYRDLTSGDAPQVRHFDVKASQDIFRGMPVRLDETTGTIIPLSGTFATDVTMVGIAADYLASQATVYQDFPVILAHQAEFVVQDDAGASVTTRATFYSTFMNDVYFGITNPTAGNSTTGQSTAELAGGTTHASAQYLKVSDWLRTADNAFLDNMKLIVRFNPALFSSGPFTTQAAA